MRTRVTIMAIVLAVAVTTAGALVLVALIFGWWVALTAVAVVGVAYRFVLRRRLARWGATDEEVRRVMPGDDVLGAAPSTTRAVTIGAAPERIWPWLVQLGFGRAGWYSYDWIDNDGRTSVDRIVPELQHLKVGDRVLMAPDLGPTVRALEPNRFMLCGGEHDTWCLGLYPLDETHTRLVSRWRATWPRTPATVFWLLVSEPASFIMERRMLLGIKERVELAGSTLSQVHRRDVKPKSPSAG
jgi:hypothetical protein